jgi:nucleoside-diphosphate-sugar epimerase
MIVLVTGSAGFIGSHLVDKLTFNNHEVIVMDKKNGQSTSDIANLFKATQHKRPDIIVHLGANCSSQISLRDPATDFTDNAVGTFNVCEFSRLMGGVPIIFNSTMKIYPGSDGVIPPYGRSKLVGEDYIRLYHELYGTEYVINRPSSVYGPRQDGSEDGGWFTWFIRAALQKQTITLFGNGTQSRDVLYIDDCVDLLFDQIEHFNKYKNKAYDFGGGPDNEVSLNELLDALNYHDTKQAPLLPGDVTRFVNDNIDVGSVNGWQPKTHWRQGMQLTMEHFDGK